MNLITVQDRIQSVIANWRHIAPASEAWRSPNGLSASEILARFEAISPNDAVAADELIAAIGYAGWVSLRCAECRELVPAVVEFEDDRGCERGMVLLCRDCVAKALAAFGSA